MSKIILHIDMNAYFATVEEILNPSLKDKPVVVGHDSKRSVVSTANYKAREYGINSAMPIMQAKKLCPRLIIVDPHYDKYEYYRDEFLKIIKKYTNIIEVASIDECYADFTNFFLTHDITKADYYIKALQDEIYQKLKLKCSIGVAPNRFLAKMASDYKKPMGITIMRIKDVPTLLWPLKIGDMFGIGKKTAPRLENIGIRTIEDLAKANEDDYALKKILGKNTQYFINLANGIGSNKLYIENENNKSIGNSETLPFNTNDYETIVAYLKKLTNNVCEKAKESKLLSNSFSIVIKDETFKTINRSITIKEYTNDYQIVIQQIINLFNQNYDDKMVRLVGVSLNNLKEVGSVKVQEKINFNNPVIKDDKTEKIIDLINKKYQKEIVKTANK